MCDGFSEAMAVAAVVSAVAGTAVSVMGQEQAADAARAQGNYQNAVARNNAILAGRAAADATARGEELARQQGIKGAQIIGAQRATLAGNGVVVDQGSALDLTTDQAGQNKLDALTIKDNAAREALGFKTQGMNFQAGGDLALLRGTSLGDAGDMGAIGAGLSGAGSVASKWYTFNNQGLFANTRSGYTGGGGTTTGGFVTGQDGIYSP